jgi:hypothetical protein
MPHYSDNTDNLSDHSLLRVLGVSFVFFVISFLAGRSPKASRPWADGRPEIFSLFWIRLELVLQARDATTKLIAPRLFNYQ